MFVSQALGKMRTILPRYAVTAMNAAKRPSKPRVAKQSKHKSRPAKPPSKPRPPRFGGGGGLEIENVVVCFQMKRRILTELDIVDQVVQYNDIPNVEQALELGAF